MLRVKSETGLAGNGKPRTTERVYDDTGRIVARRYNDDPWPCMTYDARGRVLVTVTPTLGAQPGRTVRNDWAVGNNPMVVWVPKDLPAAAAIVAQSAFLSAGQRCTAARRLIVEDGKCDEFLELLGDLLDRIIVDHPFADPQPFMGPVIDNQAADGLQESFLELLMKGGRPIKHLDRPREDRPFVSPAIIDVTAVEKKPDVEMFGPILQVIRVPDFDAALAEFLELIEIRKLYFELKRGAAFSPRQRHQHPRIQALAGGGLHFALNEFDGSLPVDGPTS
jgi:hypothetical protein